MGYLKTIWAHARPYDLRCGETTYGHRDTEKARKVPIVLLKNLPAVVWGGAGGTVAREFGTSRLRGIWYIT